MSVRIAVAAVLGMTSLASAQSILPDIVGGEAIFDVTRWGACPNDSIDDSAAVATAVADARLYMNWTPVCGTPGTEVRKAVLYFPKGKFHFASTITVPNLYALEIRGAGAFPYDISGGSGFVGTATELMAMNDAPIFKLSGVVSMYLSDFMMYYDGKEAGATQKLLHIESPEYYGTSHIKLFNVSFCRGSQAILLDNTNNNSEMIFERVNFHNVATCFTPLRHQAVNFLFNLVSAISCGTVFDLQYGGNVEVNVGNFVGCNSDYIIKTGNMSFSNGGIGCGVSKFSNIRIDSAGPGNPQTRLVILRGDQKMLFSALTSDYYTGAGPLCTVQNGSVTFDTCRFGSWNVVEIEDSNTPPASPAAIFRKTVRFRDCQFSAPGGYNAYTFLATQSACTDGIITCAGGIPGCTAATSPVNAVFAFDFCEADFQLPWYLSAVPLKNCIKNPAPGVGPGEW